jgi:DNA repair ATPase RecN
LLRRDAQRQLLDDYAGNQALVAELAENYRNWNRLRQELRELRQASSERDARLDILRYHLRELAALNLAEGEIAELESRAAAAGQRQPIAGNRPALAELADRWRRGLHRRPDRPKPARIWTP